MKLQEPYRTRPIRFLELWQESSWKLKVYGIAYQRPLPQPALVEAAKRIAFPHLRSADSREHYGVGFMGVHEGRGANWVFVDYWANENELHHHVYISPPDRLDLFENVTHTGLNACVWDMRVMWFEREAWMETVLTNPAGPDLEKYLEHRLNEDA